MEPKVGQRGATFADLETNFPKKLNLLLTNVNLSQIEVFNAQTHPDLSVAETVRAAANLLYMFPPMRLNSLPESSLGYYDYCDSISMSLYENPWPTSDASVGMATILQLPSQIHPSDNFINYTFALLESFIQSKFGTSNYDTQKTILAQCDTSIGKLILSFCDNSLSTADRTAVVHQGFVSAQNFLATKMA